MNIRRLAASAIILAASLLPTIATLGQSALQPAATPPANPPANSPANPPADPAGEKPAKARQGAWPAPISLDFPGGSATEYINAVSAAAKDVNIALVADVSKVRVPAVKLTNVDPQAALSVLQSIPPEQANNYIEFQTQVSSPQPGTMMLITIGAQSRQPRNMSTNPSATVEISQVWSVAGLLDNSMKAADLLSAIEAALAMDGDTSNPTRVKFHEATGLVIARGQRQDINSVDQVINQLLSMPRKAGAANDESIAKLRNQLSGTEQRIHDAEASALKAKLDGEAVQKSVTEWKTRAELLEKEVDRLRAMLSQREDEMQRIRQDMTAQIMELRIKAEKSQKP